MPRRSATLPSVLALFATLVLLPAASVWANSTLIGITPAATGNQIELAVQGDDFDPVLSLVQVSQEEYQIEIGARQLAIEPSLRARQAEILGQLQARFPALRAIRFEPASDTHTLDRVVLTSENPLYPQIVNHGGRRIVIALEAVISAQETAVAAPAVVSVVPTTSVPMSGPAENMAKTQSGPPETPTRPLLSPPHPRGAVAAIRALLEARQLTQADTATRDALSAWPKHAELQGLAGVVAEAQGNTERAIEHYQQAMALAPGVPYHQYRLAMLQLNTNQLVEAEQTLKRLAAMAPDDPAVFKARGYLAHKQGREEEALAFYQQSLSAEVMVNIARLCHAKGETREAMAWLASARLLAGANPQLLDEISRLTARYNSPQSAKAKSN